MIAIQMPRILRPLFKMHPNRPGRWSGQQVERLPVVDHRIVRETGDRLHAESRDRGLTNCQADHLRGLYMRMARNDGHIQAYDFCTRRAVELAVMK